MSILVNYIPKEENTSLASELSDLCRKLANGLQKEKAILAMLASDDKQFAKIFRIMIKHGLNVEDLKACSLKCAEWDALVQKYFESMEFDSMNGIENRFPKKLCGHSLVLSIPLKPYDLEKLLSIKNELECGQVDPMVSMSVLLMIGKNYGEKLQSREPSESSMMQANEVLEDCSSVFWKVLRMDIKHFFNDRELHAVEARRELQIEDKQRSRDLSIDELVSLSPIYVEKFSEMNDVSLYINLFKKLVNLKALSADLLTLPVVNALIQTGRISSLEHGLINTCDPRPDNDRLEVKMFMSGASKSLKLLHVNNCTAVIETLEVKSFPNLTELDVPQRHDECDNLIQRLLVNVPCLSKLTLRPVCLYFKDFIAQLERLCEAKPGLDTLLLDFHATELPRNTEVQDLQKISNGSLAKISTLGLLLHAGQTATLGFLKLFTGLHQLRIIEGSLFQDLKQPIEKNCLDASKPRKTVWFLVPSLKSVKLFKRNLILVHSWDR